MTDRAQIWIHPNIRYMGGEYDEDREQTYFDDAIEDRIRERIEDEEGDAIAVSTFDYDLEEQEDGTYEPRGDSQRVDMPYSFGDWDEIIEDPNYGRIKETADDSSPPTQLNEKRVTGWIEQYDEIVVRGGFFKDCEQRFVDHLADYASDDTTIIVDPANSYAKKDTDGPTGLGDPDQVKEKTDADIEKERAEQPPWANERYETSDDGSKVSFPPARKYENVIVRTVGSDDMNADGNDHRESRTE